LTASPIWHWLVEGLVIRGLPAKVVDSRDIEVIFFENGYKIEI
jgi:hypothetical protein